VWPRIPRTLGAIPRAHDASPHGRRRLSTAAARQSLSPLRPGKTTWAVATTRRPQTTNRTMSLLPWATHKLPTTLWVHHKAPAGRGPRPSSWLP
jgi:hypothetical protein